LLRFHVSRPTAYGLEMHLASIHQFVTRYQPSVVVLDSVTTFLAMGSPPEVTSMIVRLVDFLKMKGITLVMNVLVKAGEGPETTGVNISSLVDTWLILSNAVEGGTRTRMLAIAKARGMRHSNQPHELVMSKKGVEIKSRATIRTSP